MVAPIFRFRNVKVRLSTNTPTFIYGVIPFDSSNPDKTLAEGIFVEEVSTVILTVQVSNLTGGVGFAPAQTVLVSSFIQNATTIVFDSPSARALVSGYPLISNNAFDPLSGNLVLSENDQVWIQTDIANTCDVTVSLLEIANATAS
jgi:hypothetical protein